MNKDRECVDEVLALEQDRLKFAKRKLRVQRCKTLPGAPKLRTTGQKSSGTSQQKSRGDGPTRPHTAPTTPVSVPQGDPTLGNKIAGLSKEERKKVKSTDADRVARRLAKKKARMAMGPAATAGKDRERVRKPKAPAGGPSKKKPPVKGRVRSERSVAKRNAKK